MIRIEYKNNGTHIETKWVQEAETSSAMLGRLMLPIDVFGKLKIVLEYNSPMSYQFIEKKDV